MPDASVRNNKIIIRKSRDATFPSSGLSAGEFAFSYPIGALYLGSSGGNGVVDAGGPRLNSTFSKVFPGYEILDNAISVNAIAETGKAGVEPSGGTLGITMAAGMQLQKTPEASSNNLEIATTAYVTNAVAGAEGGVSSLTGITGAISLISGKSIGITTAPAQGGIAPHITLTGLTASHSADIQGVASYNSNNFSIADNGMVSIKNEGIGNAKLANSSIPIEINSQNHGGVAAAKVNTGLTLGEGLTFEGTSNQVKIAHVSSADGIKLTWSLPPTVNLTNGITAPNLDTTLATVTDLNVSAGVTIGGDLTVNGTLTTISTTNLEIEDVFLELANDGSNGDNDYGFFQQIGGSLHTGLAYDSSTSRYYLFESDSFNGTDAIVTTEHAGNMAEFRAKLNGSVIDGGGF